jgi:hypothetical protein
MHLSQTTETDESQAAPGFPSSVHSFPPISGHETLGQAVALLQSTSQPHESTQSIRGHDAAPEQPIWHSCLPQRIAPHEAGPEQSISQLPPSEQSTSPHAPGLLHRIVQSKPGGHCTAPHGRLALQSIRQVRPLLVHELHSLGHCRSTQNPRSQVRPLSQSPLLLQV